MLFAAQNDYHKKPGIYNTLYCGDRDAGETYSVCANLSLTGSTIFIFLLKGF